jgi:hypothetical protein
MSRHKHRDPFQSIDPTDLAKVGGGASRVTARSSGNDQLTTMLTQITQSIQALSQNNNQQDPMQMMLMMMMMGGMGGGGGGAVAAPPPAPAAPQAPVINITTTVRHHGW